MRSNCNTPGCKGGRAPETESEPRFCARCGWPLGRAEVHQLETEIHYPEGDFGEFSVRLRNVGSGALKWNVGDLPDGVRLLESPGWLPRGEELVVHFEIDGQVFQSQELTVLLETLDKAGEDSTDYRLCPMESCYNRHALNYSSKAKKVGPLVVPCRTVLFFSGERRQKLPVENRGQTDLDVSYSVSSGTVEIPFSNEGKQRAISQKLGAGLQQSVYIHLPLNEQSGILNIQSAGLKSPLEVHLVRVPNDVGDFPDTEYVIAIDFGTTKSAVMVFHQCFEGAEPEHIPWEKQDGQTEWYVPSRVVIKDGRPIAFGWETRDSQDVVESIKTELTNPTETIKRCVVYVLERLLDRVAEVKGIEVFDDVTVVLSLPVLDDGPLAEKQRRNTLECAVQAGQRYRLGQENFQTFTEPECAMVDILHTLQENAEAVRLPAEDDWLCVVDLGGGTTDISLTQFGVAGGGRPELKNLKVTGYKRAGDFVDQELFLHCYQRWAETGRLEGDDLPVVFEPALLKKKLNLKAETIAPNGLKIFHEIRNAKEYIFGADEPREYTLDSFAIKRNHLTLDPKQLSEGPLAYIIEAIFGGAEPDGSDSFRRKLQEWNISDQNIRFLFLTGGTSRIPTVENTLRAGYLRYIDLFTLPNSEPRKNVVRGAALRPSLKVKNLMPCAFELQFSDNIETLEKKSIPGKTVHCSAWVERGQQRPVQVTLQLDGRTYEAAHVKIELAPDDPSSRVRAKVSLTYTPEREVVLSAEWLRANSKRSFEPIVLARIPRT